jgi:signal transduction histidine kinase
LLVFSFVLISLVIGALGYRYYLIQKASIETQVRAQLEDVAKLKIAQVVAWRKGRTGDAAVIEHTPLTPGVRQVLAGKGEPKVRDQVLAWMRSITAARGYYNAILVNTQGKVCLSVGPVRDHEGHYAELAKQVIGRDETIFSDIHYDGGMAGPHLGLAVPLRLIPGGPPEGVLLLGIDPNDFLYPLIQPWPTPSRTAETLLARREGNEVVFLNVLRHRQGAPLKLRLPLTESQVPAVRAALGEEGVANGIDYRGVPVLAAFHKVPGSPWILVAKVDADEIYAPIHQDTLWLGLIGCALALAMAAGGGFFWRHARAQFYRQKYEAELERRTAEEDKSRLQQQLQHAQKMETVGRLAGGVAHDFNNLLTVINGYAALLLGGLAQDDPLRDPISEIKKAGDRAADLTGQLLAFSRKQVVEFKIIDLNEVIKDSAKMLRRLVGEDIEVVTRLSPSLGRVRADTGQMHQVLMNLAVNAKDAMPDGGKLIIETEDVDVGEDYVAAHADMQAGPHVLLTVTDTGVGMDHETQRRAFDPFFTTKGEGEGTGLGLSTVYGIVKQSGGWIWLYSEPGKGVTLKIYLPRVMEPAEQPAELPSSQTSLRGTETILVVEDQSDVRKLTSSILKRYGYRVLEASNGSEALQICGQEADPIALMITDVVMPGMTGRELAARLKPLRPGLKVLYISGYTADIIGHQEVFEKRLDYLSKPFPPEALASKLRELLE